MKIDAMIDYFKTRGFEVSCHYNENSHSYTFRIDKDGNFLTRNFRYSGTSSSSEMDRMQRKFLEEMIKRFSELYYQKVDDHHCVYKSSTTVSEVFNTLNEQQRTAVYKIVGEAIHTNFYRPEIKDVIFNDPATIVFWTDGTKTVVKCQEGDIFDPEKGLTMAIAKKVYGNKGSYCNVIKKWCEPYHEKQDYNDAVTKAVYEKLSTICDAFTKKYGCKESNKTDRKYELVYETRADAEKVLNRMSEIIDEYGFVTVADLYDISGLPGAYYTDSKIGWKGSIKEPTVKRVRNGYIIDLPEPKVLE